MGDNTHYIQEIDRLRYELQELKIKHAELERMAKSLIDAAVAYKDAKPDKKQQQFIILKNCEQRLKEKFYPKKKAVSQATLDWLGQ